MLMKVTVITADVLLSLQTPDEQLLVLMSNLNYTRNQVIPRLFDCFVSHGYPPCPQVSDVSNITGTILCCILVPIC